MVTGPTVAGIRLPIAVTDDPDGARTWIAEHFGASSTVPGYRALFEMEGAGGAADVVVVNTERHVNPSIQKISGMKALTSDKVR